MGENVFMCTPSTPFSNPFVMKGTSNAKGCLKCDTYEETVDLFKKYFDKAIVSIPEVKERWENLIEMYHKHGEVYLGCMFRNDVSAHVDYIKEKLEKHLLKETVRKLMIEKKGKRLR